MTATTTDPISDPSPQARSRRAVLAGALGGLVAAVAGALGRPESAAAAAGGTMIIGSEANNAGTANTQLLTNSSVVAFKLLQNGPGTALMGYATPPSGATRGVYGRSDSPAGYGIQGRNGGAQGTGAAIQAVGVNNIGLDASTDNNVHPAIKAVNNGGGTGIYGNSGAGYAIHGSSNSGVGIVGVSETAQGVYGSTVTGKGVHGYALTSGVGVKGEVGGSGFGVEGLSSTVGVRGAGGSQGVIGETTNGHGVFGYSTTGHGVHGASNYHGVYGDSAGGWGVYGNSTNGYAVYGISSSGTGVVGFGGAYAGYFGGLLYANSVNAAIKNFRIDHPLDPAGKVLTHSCVESNERKLVYDGVVTTDAKGEATVELPAYFDALNRDLRYQLTVVGAFAQAIVKSRVKGNRFTIATSEPGIEVSWQVTGVRQDAYAKAHPLAVEAAKTGREKGKYLNPVEHGKPESAGVDFDLRQDGRRPAAAVT